MPSYKITIVSTDIYDAEVEADSLEEAQQEALAEPDLWVLSTVDSSSELGDDHYVWNDVTNAWVTASE